MSDERVNRSTKCKKCFSSFVSMVFSTLGLIILITTYTIIGGLIFQNIEQDEELLIKKRAREEMSNSKMYYVEKLWNVTERRNILYKSNWSAEIMSIVEELQRNVHNLTVKYDWDGKMPGELIDPEWSFAGAILYAATAITSIGYGHVTPKTMTGQLVTILYCIIGLPLTLLFVSRLGGALACVFRIIYHTCCCAVCCLCCMTSKQRQRKYMKQQANDMHETLCALVITQKDGSKAANMLVNGGIKKQTSVTEAWCARIKAMYKVGLDHDAHVPAYLCLIVMLGYIAGGGWLFSRWESWTFMEGAYFCFITLTTIGFGDFVPGIGTNGDQGKNINLVLCAIYVFIGLAFIGMCIELMQKDVISKLKWIGRFIGISESKKKESFTDKKKETIGLKLFHNSNEPLNDKSGANTSKGSSLTRSASYQLELPAEYSNRAPLRSISMPAAPYVMMRPYMERMTSYPAAQMEQSRTSNQSNIDKFMDINSNHKISPSTSSKETNIL